LTKRTLGFALAAALLAPIFAHAADPTPTPTAATTAPKRNAKRLQGKVSAMDAAKRTLTITTRRDPVGTTVTVAPDAKILTQQPATMADVKVGDKITAFGQNITSGVTTLDATRLLILPAAGANAGKKKPAAQAGYRKNSVDGVVASTTPALTMTTPGGVTVTVKTTPETKVAKTATGTLSDVTVGATVQVRTNGSETSPTATEVRVTPANANAKGRAGAKKRNRKNAGAPVAATAPVTPAAP